MLQVMGSPAWSISRIELTPDVDEDWVQVGGQAQGIGSADDSLYQSAARSFLGKHSDGNLAVYQVQVHTGKILLAAGLGLELQEKRYGFQLIDVAALALPTPRHARSPTPMAWVDTLPAHTVRPEKLS